MPNFPHMDSSRRFPHGGNVNVYKYENELDYGRFDYTQMKLTICNVPWDMGEAHIGTRTISGIGNVVWFGDKEKRDKWFDDIPDSECIRFETKFKELHRDGFIKVPIPYDIACTYNYLVVEYSLFANDDSPLMLEKDGGVRKWFWFIREVVFDSPNTTRLMLVNDAWQTFMYDLNISGMMLERGHAPLFATDADAYLANPMENNTGLLAEDVNYGNEPVRVKSATAHVFNSETRVCIATTANPGGTWGTKAADSWRTPASNYYNVNGTPDYRIFSITPGDLNTFLANVDRDFPQFKQTIKGVFFAPTELLTLGGEFTFAGVTCNNVSTTSTTIDFLHLQKGQFGYPARYANLAKLYTYPYAHIEVTDENGQTDIIKIENTDGTIDINACLSLAFPAIGIQAHLLGVGGGDSRVTFANITSRSLTIGGRWYETLHSWDVPVFGVIQQSSTHNDYDTHFDRKQQVTAYTNEYDSSVASADTDRTNANASADTQKSNADASADTDKQNADVSANADKNNANDTADTLVTNAGLQTTANSAIVQASNAASSAIAQATIAANNGNTAHANAYTNNTTNNQIDYQYASAAISAVSGIATSGAGAAASALTGNPAGAVTGLIGGLIGAGTAMANAQAAVNLDSAQAAAATSNNSLNASTANTLTSEKNSNATSAETVKNTSVNSVISGTSANTAATQKGNASRTQSAVKGNATRTQGTTKGNATRTQGTTKENATRTRTTAVANAGRTRDTAQNAIANQVAQAALGAPLEFGQFQNTGQSQTRPMGLFANVVTQTDNAIKMAGDEFLRYGYAYNGQWDFDGNWTIGKHFTYWKLSDFWVKGLSIPDMYVDKLRFFLFGGVTVWDNPADIGNVSIYDN